MSEGFSVRITRAVEGDLNDLEPYRRQVVGKLLALEENPYMGHALKGALKGLRSLEFSLPGGACRAVYEVKKEEKACLMVIIGYHEGLYERAERRIKGWKR
jgi:mRNA-degrading endonuclease YafQ of YafQ-DinJ toxin-antitoxin module